MITIQKYIRAQSLEEAYTLNQSKNNRIIGGMLWLKMGKGSVNTAIDLSDLGLNKIEESDEEFSIGAMVTLREIENHEGLNSYTNGAIKNAVKDIVGVQFRNMATVGGSIYGRFGFSDVLTVFLAMESYVELYKGGIVPLSEYAKMKYDSDIVVRLIVKKVPGEFVYTSMRATRTDFPIIALAVSKIKGETKVSVGARPARAIIIEDKEHILADGINEASAKAFSEYVKKNTPTSSNTRGSAKYRSHLIEVLTYRSLLSLGGLN